STGLSEMLNDVPQLRVHIDEEAFDEAAFVNELSTNICLLLDDAELRQCVSQQMRANYLSHFTLRQMEQAIHQVIVSLLPHSPLLSGEMLQEVDIYMMRLIHQQPDIDMDFYGMAGIGVYLWWRYQTLKGTDEEIMRAKIGEYLIYYLGSTVISVN
ncbi:glycosyltransferase, group 1 family protein, partial [gut metagenome]